MRTRITLALVAVLLVPLVAAGSASHPAPASTLTALRADALDHEPPSTTAPSTTVAPTTTSTTLAPTTTIEVTTTTSEPEVEAQPSPPTTKPRPRPATSAATAAEPTSTVPVPSTEPAPPETTTTAAPEPEPAPSALCVSVYGSPAPDWLAGAILAAGWPSDQLTNVCKIAGCESNFHTTSHGSSGVYGLMQVMARSRPWSGILEAHGWDKDSLYDPVINLTVAHEGWALMGSVWSSSQWSCTYALRH